MRLQTSIKVIVFTLAIFCMSGCETAYYNAWEKVGVHKRDILVDRIEDTQQAQEKTQEQFKDALEQYRALVNFDGGNLDRLYKKLDSQYQASDEAAQQIRQRIEEVDDVAKDLFSEWEKELDLYTDTRLKQDSASKLRDTRFRYSKLLAAMNRAEKSVHPVLNTLQDQVLYLKHNLNARAVSSLKGELSSIDADVETLVREMQKSIDESSRFIATLR